MKKQHILIRIIMFFLRGGLIVFELFLGFLLVLIVIVILVSKISPPDVDDIDVGERVQIAKDHYVIGENWLKKNEYGVWEMYIEGAPYERGVIYGKLAKELVQKQETIFVGQIDNFVPSQTWQQFLRLMLGFFNRNLPSSMSLENQQEIYGVSQSFSDEYNYIASKYSRILNYHAAHDIGHALNDYSMVGCTSFAIKGEKTADESLLVGRNFDFFVGDEFAKNKIVLFVKPESGIPFASITWGGMIGVLSGINQEGLTITLNSAKSELPFFAKTPVSIIAREILQYAKTIDEAYEIAKKRPSFVAESFMISSAIDHRIAIIEKTPDTTILYQNNRNDLILTNHFQSDILKNTVINKENLEENVTGDRYQRVEELLAHQNPFGEQDFARILRDTRGLYGEDIGLGNEGAINQLIAHHSIIFKPEMNQFWISSSPYQLGSYISYQLDTVFSHHDQFNVDIHLKQANIPRDSNFIDREYQNFKKFKYFVERVKMNKPLDVKTFEKCNPNYFYTYEVIGDYYALNSDSTKAEEAYKRALNLFVPNFHEVKRIQNKINDLTP